MAGVQGDTCKAVGCGDGRGASNIQGVVGRAGVLPHPLGAVPLHCLQRHAVLHAAHHDNPPPVDHG